MPLQNDPLDGKFSRQHEFWTPESWDDGYFDADNRFRVYRPDYPRAYGEGYALRSHIVWWLGTGSVHPSGTKIHHINQDRADDRFDNLANVSAEAHVRIHCSIEWVHFVCEKCLENFTVPPWRVRQRKKEGIRIRFCSMGCRNKNGLSEDHRRNISIGLRRNQREVQNGIYS
jgi:hypothetical protein